MANMRISGLASGMDIDSIVSDMMKVKRMPLDKLKQQKQTMEWQRDDYREMNTLLQSLDQTIFDNVFLQKSFISKKVSSSNEGAVTAVAINSQANVSNQIEVINLAEAASWKASGKVNTVDTDATAIFENSNGSIKLKTSLELNFKVKDPGSESFKNVSFKLDAGDSIETVISKINNSGLGVSAMREKINISSDPEVNDYQTRVVFTSNKSGSGGEIASLDTTTNKFLSDLGFSISSTLDIDTDGDTIKDGYNLVKAKSGIDATIKINGYQLQQTSNVFTINGIQYTIKSKTTAGAPSTVSATTDVEAVYKNIKTFVDKYNEVIEKVNKELKEEVYRSYKPLSEEQKEAMTEKQVELWEEKARSGLLRNDSILSSALSSMRLDLYTRVGTELDNVNNEYDQLSEIGITTSSNYLDGGKLIIDESKLKEVIEKDSDVIYKLFTNDSEEYNSKGLARRVRDSLKESMESIVEKAGNSLKINNQFTIGKLINNVNSQMDSLEERLTALEDRYYRQFTAMEKAIQNANQQSAYITQNFFS